MDKKSGFVAGTLVHTDKGLVPIQNLKVGDLVLSKSNDGLVGELNFQRITQTHRFENNPLYMFHVVELYSDGTESKISQVFTTPNHPLWKENVGWVRADLLKNDDKILLISGRKVNIFGGSPVLRTKNSKNGWVARDLEPMGEINATNFGFIINFTENGIVTPFNDYQQWANADVDYWSYAADDLTGDQFSDWAYSDIVYNLTVENTQTYFIGDSCIWVHQ